MKESKVSQESGDFRLVIGFVLRYGVIAAFIIVAVGSVLLFLQGRTGYAPIGTAEELFNAPNTSLVGLLPLLQGVTSAKPYAIIDLGLIVLLGTPVVRVLVSIFLFIKERSLVFVAITTVVFAILLLSMFLVAPLVSA